MRSLPDGTASQPCSCALQVLEIRESIGDADLKQLQQIDEQNIAKTTRCLEDLREAFERKDWVRAKAATARLSYLRTINEELRKRLPER